MYIYIIGDPLISICEKLSENIKLFLSSGNLGLSLAVQLLKKFKEAKGDMTEVTDLEKAFVQNCLNTLVFQINAGGLTAQGNYCEVKVHY